MARDTISRIRLPRHLLILSGGAMILSAILWWLIVFSKVMGSGSLGFGQTLVCMGSSSTLCDLAMAICSANHFLGIKFYSPYLLWIGILLATTSAMLELRQKPSR